MRRVASISSVLLVLGTIAAAPPLTLRDALDAAVAASPSVAAADARVREMEDDLAAASASANPSLSASYVRTPQGGSDGSTIAQRLTTIGGTFDVNGAVARGALVATASAELRSAQFARLDAVRAERIRTIGLVFDFLRAQADERLRTSELDGAKSDLDAARQRYRAGDAPHIDITRAEVSVSQALAAQAAASVAAENARDALATETERDVAGIMIGAEDVSADAAQRSKAEFVEIALTARPDVQQAKSDVEAAKRALQGARQDELPRLSGSFGYTTGIDAGVNVHGPSASVAVSIPVSSKTSYEADAAHARVLQAQSRLDDVRRRVRVEVSAQVREIPMLRSNLQHARTAEEAARTELRAIVSGYATGAASSLDVIEARRTFLGAELERVQDEYSLQQALITLREIVSP